MGKRSTYVEQSFLNAPWGEFLNVYIKRHIVSYSQDSVCPEKR